MSKLTLEFDCSEDSPEAAVRALKATQAYLVIWEMFQELRKIYKYSEDEIDAEHADKWADKLRELCEQHGIDVWLELQ
jgi:hypothetical protein